MKKYVLSFLLLLFVALFSFSAEQPGETEQKTYERLLTNYNQLSKEYQNLLTELEKSKELLKTWEQLLSEKEKSNRLLLLSANELRKRVNELESLLKQKEQSIQTISGHLTALESRLTGLDSSLKKVKTSLESALKQIRRAKIKIGITAFLSGCAAGAVAGLLLD